MNKKQLITTTVGVILGLIIAETAPVRAVRARIAKVTG